MMRNSQKVSVLIAAYNAESTILSAVKSSLLGLTSQDEVLVFLDGCTDKTKVKLGIINDKRLRVFESKSNLGRVAARNKLYQESQGDIICILDADDIAMPWRFSVSRFLLRKYDVVFGSAFLFGELPLGLIFMTYPYRLTPHFSNIELTYKNPFVHSTVAIKRGCISSNYLYNDVVAEEYDLWIRLALAGKKIFRTAAPLSAYRIHRSQLSNNPDFYALGEQCQLLQNHRRDLVRQLRSKFNLDADDSLEALARSHLGIRLEYIISNGIRKFRK